MAIRVHPQRTRWHLLFATGTVEQIDGERGKPGRRVTWTRPMLESMVAARNALDAHTSRLGTSRQPWPVSLHHAIERRLYFNEEVPDANLVRMGNGYALHYHPGSDDATAGLYGLIEWTPQGMSEIEDGRNITLSPTTHPHPKSITDGRTFPQTIVAVGLVDVPKLDTIGTARESYALDRFPSDVVEIDSMERVEARSQVATYWSRNLRRASPESIHSGVVMRSALTVGRDMDDVTETETEMIDDANMMAAGMPAKRSADEIMTELDADAELRTVVTARLCAPESRAAGDGMGMEAVTKLLETVLSRFDRLEGLVGKTAANSTDAADAAEMAADATLMAEARRANDTAARAAVLRRVQAREIVGDDNVRTAFQRLRTNPNADLSDIVVARSAEPTPKGSITGTGAPTPAEKPTNPRAVRLSDIRAELRRSMPQIDGEVDPSALAAAVIAKRREMDAAGAPYVEE